jgi:hypothetical protein
MKTQDVCMQPHKKANYNKSDGHDFKPHVYARMLSRGIVGKRESGCEFDPAKDLAARERHRTSRESHAHKQSVVVIGGRGRVIGAARISRKYLQSTSPSRPRRKAHRNHDRATGTDGRMWKSVSKISWWAVGPRGRPDLRFIPFPPIKLSPSALLCSAHLTKNIFSSSSISPRSILSHPPTAAGRR